MLFKIRRVPMLRATVFQRCQTLFAQISCQAGVGVSSYFNYLPVCSLSFSSKGEVPHNTTIMGRSKFRQRNRDKKEHKQWEDRRDAAEAKAKHGNDPNVSIRLNY